MKRLILIYLHNKDIWKRRKWSCKMLQSAAIAKAGPIHLHVYTHVQSIHARKVVSRYLPTLYNYRCPGLWFVKSLTASTRLRAYLPVSKRSPAQSVWLSRSLHFHFIIYKLLSQFIINWNVKEFLLLESLSNVHKNRELRLVKTLKCPTNRELRLVEKLWNVQENCG